MNFPLQDEVNLQDTHEVSSSKKRVHRMRLMRKLNGLNFHHILLFSFILSTCFQKVTAGLKLPLITISALNVE